MEVPGTVGAAIALTLTTWLLIVVTVVVRYALVNHARLVWGKFIVYLVTFQAAVLLVIAKVVNVIPQLDMVIYALHFGLIPGTVLVYDQRNDENQFMLRSGIYLIVLVLTLLVDARLCYLNWRAYT